MEYIIILVFVLFILIIETSHFKYDDLIRKPYRVYQINKVIDEIDDQTHFDHNCPSIVATSGRKISGCSCKSNKIECSAANVLNKFPVFKMNNTTEGTQHIVWNIYLKCKNFTLLDNIYKNINLLKWINQLDLSHDHDKHHNTCNYTLNAHEPQHRIVRLRKMNITDINSNISDSNVIKIEYLNLKHNLINDVNLNTNRIRIKSISLAFNNLTKLKSHQIKNVEIEALNLSFNAINSFDAEYFYDRNLLTIDLSHNKLDRLNSPKLTAEKEYSYLVNLNLSNNLFKEIPFNENTKILASLELLNLSSNHIVEITENNLISFKNLKYLYLNKNLINQIHEHSFKHLSNLQILDLSSNFIVNLTSTYLFESQMFNLKELNLNLNLIETISINTLKYLHSLKYLHLSHNKLSVLNNFTFGYMKSLIEIDLSNNLIEFLENDAFNIHKYSYLGPGLLEKLDLSSNLIRTLPTNLFQYLINLRYLLLNKNSIKAIDNKIFDSIHSLIHLDLSMNSFNSLNILLNSNLRTLKYLKLSNNLLKTVQNKQFIYLKSLRYLDLSSNQINTINDCAFYGLENSIKKLILNYNQINIINACAFSSVKFYNLRFLHLLNNPINCTSNCNFFHLLFNKPYSLAYHGNECLINHLDFSTLNCTNEHYNEITSSCQERSKENNCHEYEETAETEIVEYNHNDTIYSESHFSLNNSSLNKNMKINSPQTISYNDTVKEGVLSTSISVKYSHKFLFLILSVTCFFIFV